MAEYLKILWNKVGAKSNYDQYRSNLDAILMVNGNKGVVLDHSKGAKKVLVSVSGDSVRVIAEYPKNYTAGHECKSWLAGNETIEDNQFER